MIDWAHWQRLGDPTADRVMEALAAEDQIWAVNALLRAVEQNAQALPTSIPSEVRQFFDQTSVLPSWADPHRLERASSFAEAHLPYVSVSLLCASLPLLFSGAKGASILGRTRRLVDDVDARVNETGRFVLDVLEPGGFLASGKAIRSAQKVRLVHASVRHHLRERDGDVPINQQQMLATLLAFSVVAIRSMERLGARIERRDAEDFWHLWRVTGAILGVDERLIPGSLDDARNSIEDVIDRFSRPSEEGRQLTATLIDGMNRHLGVASGGGFAPRFVRYLIGDHMADVLGVEAARGALPPALLARRSSEWVRRLSPYFARRVHHAIVQAKLEGKRPSFPAPVSIEAREAPSRSDSG